MAARTAAAAGPAEREIAVDTNPYATGDVLTTGNNLRDKFGISKVVIRSGIRLVTIRNTTTRKTYTRAWWNLNPTRAGAPTERR